MHFDLANQSNSATTGHAQAATAAHRRAARGDRRLRDQLFTAQSSIDEAGELDGAPGAGGPEHSEPARTSTSASTTSSRATIAPAHRSTRTYSSSTTRGIAIDRGGDDGAARRHAARWPAARRCSTPSRSGSPASRAQRRSERPGCRGPARPATTRPAGQSLDPGAARYRLDRRVAPHARPAAVHAAPQAARFETIQTTDPGRALITGKWKDIGRSRDRSFARWRRGRRISTTARRRTCTTAVDFYNERFGIGFTDDEKDDLVAFLRTL